MKWRHGCFECSKADVMGILKSWRHGYCEYLWSDLWVFWIFVRWRHWYFEYSRSDVTEIFRSWRHGYFEIHIQNYRTFEYSKYQCHYEYSKYLCHIFKILKNSKFFDFFWIFKIPMTSLQEYSKYQCHYEYSKYQCHIFKITLLLNI